MNYPHAIDVVPLAGYKFLITFDNGARRFFDVSPYIIGSWFGELRDKRFFSAVRLDGHTVVWPNGQGIAPHELFECSVPA